MLTFEATPDPRGDIRAMRNRSITWHDALCELIDNSFDAGARRVDIDFSKRFATIADDGVGCLDHNAMVQRGCHRHQKTTTIGRYGVGLKNVSAATASELVIRSVHRDREMSVRVNWEHREKMGNWEYTTSEVSAKAGEKSGTVVTLSSLRRLPPKIDEVLGQLAFTYAPRGDRQISVSVSGKRRMVPAYKMPDMDHAIIESRKIDEKRSYKVHAGVLKPDSSAKVNGFIVAVGHRVIRSTFEPCGEYGGSRFYGFVELIGDWCLSDHKTEIVEGGAELWDELHRVCIEPLKRASEVARNMEIAGLENLLSNQLTDVLSSNRKAVRQQSREVIGRIVPKETGVKHRRAAKSQNGATFKERVKNGVVKVRFEHINNDSLAAIQDSSTCIVITLNLNNQYVQAHLKDSNTSMCYQFVACQLAAWWCLQSEDNEAWRSLLPHIRSGEGMTSYSEALSSMLRSESPAMIEQTA